MKREKASKIKDLMGFVTSNFLKASPPFSIKEYIDDILQECSLLVGQIAPLLPYLYMKEVSNIVQRRSYVFWKEQGFIKKKVEKKVNWVKGY